MQCSSVDRERRNNDYNTKTKLSAGFQNKTTTKSKTETLFSKAQQNQERNFGTHDLIKATNMTQE